MAEAARAYVDVAFDSDRIGGDLHKAVDDAEPRIKGRFEGLGKVAAAAFGAVAAVGVGSFLKGAIGSASDLGETVSKTQVLFGDASGSVLDFSKTAAKELGQSQTAALDAVGTFGNLFRAMGSGEDEAARLGINLTRLGSDLASFNNTSPQDAAEALGAALRGEAEPIRRYGVLLDDATLKNRALSLGLIKNTKGTLPPAIRAQAAYAEILAQTAVAQGDFGRTSGGLANQQRILSAQFENIKARIGQGLLPVMTSLATFTNTTLLPAISSAWPKVQEIISGVVAAVLPPLQSLGKFLAGQFLRGFQAVVGFFDSTLLPAFDTAKLGVSALIAAFRDPDVTSNGFVGFMERVGVAAREAFTGLQDAWAKYGRPALAAVVEYAGQVATWFVEHWPAIRGAATDVFKGVQSAWERFGRPALKGVIDVAQGVVSWIVDHWAEIQDVFVASVGVIVGATTRIGAAIESTFSWLQDHKELVIAAVSGIAAVILTVGVVAFVGWAVAAASAAAATLAAVAAALVAAAPFIAVGVAIAAIVGGLVYAYRNFETFRDIVTATVDAVGKVISTFVELALGAWHLFGDDIVKVVQGAWTIISGVVDGTLKEIKGYIDIFIGIFTGDWGRAWDGVKEVVSGAWEVVKSIVSGAFTILSGIVGAGIDGIVLYFVKLPSLILGALGNLAGFLTSKGLELIGGLLGGITDKAGDLITYFLNLPGKIVEWIGDIAGTMARVGKAIIGGIVDGLQELGGQIRDKIMSFIPSPGDIVSGVGGKVGGALNHVGVGGFHLASGGKVLQGGWTQVGERGPEWLRLPAGAEVINNGFSNVRAQDVRLNTGITPTAVADLTPAAAPNVRVFIGDRELTDIVRVEVDDHDQQLVGAVRAGQR